MTSFVPEGMLKAAMMQPRLASKQDDRRRVLESSLRWIIALPENDFRQFMEKLCDYRHDLNPAQISERFKIPDWAADQMDKLRLSLSNQEFVDRMQISANDDVQKALEMRTNPSSSEGSSPRGQAERNGQG